MSTSTHTTPSNKKAFDCFIGLGSNLNSAFGNPFQTLQSSLRTLQEVDGLNILAVSSCYISKPHGPQNQNNYHNAVVKIHTDLPADLLLQTLHKVENIYGRERNSAERWGARTLDLDILLYENLCINSDSLTIPHSELSNREFVLLPLMEIDPELILPDGKKLKSLAEKCYQNGIIKLDQPLWP